MSYLRGISGARFKTDPEGRRLFFPFGMFGKARLLRDEAEEARERESYQNWFLSAIWCGSVIGAGTVLIDPFAGKVAFALGVTAALYVWLFHRVRKLPKVDDARYSTIDGWRRSAQDHSYASLIACTLGCLAFVAAGFWIYAMPKMETRWVGAIGIIFFGLALVMWCTKIWLKVRGSSGT